MSGDEARDMAYRLADALMAGSGITKAAGGAYTAEREAYADAWFPFADVMVNRTRELADRMDENLQKVRHLYDQDQAMKSAATQMFDVTLAREPRGAVPYDPGQFVLRTELVRAENPVRGSDQQSCSPSRPAVMITDHVPAVRLPPDHADGLMAATVPA